MMDSHYLKTMGEIMRFWTWKREVLKQIEDQRKEYHDTLFNSIPEGLSEWRSRDAECVIKDIIENAFSKRAYYQGDDKNWNIAYPDIKILEKHFIELREIWTKLVIIDIRWDGDYRLEVIFKPR